MATWTNKELARRFYAQILNERKLHLIDELISDKFVDHNPEPGIDPGRAGMLKMFEQLFVAFPDMTMKIEQIIGEGDRVGVRLSITGTHYGTFNGVEGTGRTMTVTGFDWLRFENGLCVERWGVFDQTTMMKKLGLIPTPTAGDLKGLSHKYFDILDNAKGDLAPLRKELLHPNLLVHFSGQPQPLKLDGFQDLTQMFWKAFPDIDHTIVDQIIEGDTVFTRLTVKGTHKGEFAGIKATDKTLTTDLITEQRWIDGKLVETWIELDMLTVLKGIGALPTK